MHNPNEKMTVPPELMHPFFFSTKEIHMEIPSGKMFVHENFAYEILYYNDKKASWPWEVPDTSIPLLMKEWELVKTEIEQLHSQRDQSNILMAMKKGMGLFLQLLFWSNDKPVNLLEVSIIDSFTYKPVNVQERLNFLLSRPKLFHSFIQLGELMKEQEKQFVIKKIKKTR